MPDIPTTLTEAAAALRAGDVTSVELTEAGYAVADELDPALGTYIARYQESALAAAAAADAERAAGVDKGPLHGIPLGIKDIIACLEGPTQANSVVNDPQWMLGLDAPVVARLRAAGAIITGKLGTSEYACGMPDASKPFPTPRNPWNADTWPGGSSSGAGSGVASGMFFGALGTDTGGSIRLPAAYCGISGLKATYGLVPKSGCLPLGVTYDHIGPMARTAADCAAMLDVMAGFEAGDPSMAAGAAGTGYVGQLAGDLRGVRIGVERAHTLGKRGEDPALAAVFEAAVAALAEAGATVVEVELPLYDELFTATMAGFQVEAFTFHKDWLTDRWTDYGRHTRGVLGAGALFTAADYAQMQKVRRIAAAMLVPLFESVDLVVSPTAGTGAPVLSELDWETAIAQCHTPYWNATGSPAMSVPMGFNAEGLPLGLQIAGRHFEDGVVLSAGHAFQQVTSHVQVPALAAAVHS